MKKMNKKGFTLAELLIVIAIMAILIAIAIPVFTAQLERARQAVDRSAARSASSLAYSEYMLTHSDVAAASGGITYTFCEDDQGNLHILSHQPVSGGTPYDDDGNTGSDTAISGKSNKIGSTALSVTIEDGAVKANTWLEKLGEDD